MPTIYIDVLFSVNLIINYILLKACCVLSGLTFRKIRIFIGAFIGACYAVLIFFPNFSVIYSTICKLLISMLIVAASFSFYSMRSYLKSLLLFYVVSFGFGGCVLGIFYFSDVGTRLGAVYSNGILYFNLPWTILAVSGIVFYLSVKIVSFFSDKIFTNHSLRKKLLLFLGDKTAEITALLDTGNALVDPVSLSPVIIVEYKQVKNLFNEDVIQALDRSCTENLHWLMKDITQKGLPVRLIPFSSVGKENGMLLGFVPDKAEIYDDCGVKALGKCVIALYDKPLSKDRSYGALLNPYL